MTSGKNNALSLTSANACTDWCLNTITNLMVYYPQWGAPYPPGLILHGEQIKIPFNPIIIPNTTIPSGKHEFYNKPIGRRCLCDTISTLLIVFQSPLFINTIHTMYKLEVNK